MINDYVWQKKYAAYKGETFEQGANRVATYMGVPEIEHKTLKLQFSPAGRVWYAAGKPTPYMQNCALFGVEDSKQGWTHTMQNVMLSLMCGAGIGVSYDEVRPFGSLITGLGGTASGPISLMHSINEVARHVRQGGSRRSACYASLHWLHDDIFSFISVKDWSTALRQAKALDPNAIAPLDIHNISVRYDLEFLAAYRNPTHKHHTHAVRVFDTHMSTMFRTGEPGIQFDADNQVYRNGCTEIISDIDGDSCTLGSTNWAVLESIDDLIEVTSLGVQFLMQARLKSHYPTEHMRKVAHENMRIGLGYFGLHNWLLKRGYNYAPNDELATWLSVFRDTARRTADNYADLLGVPRPVAVLSIAPTGSISTLYGSVASGIEPIYSAAFVRRYADGTEQTIVDPHIAHLVRQGVLSIDDTVQDAYSMATPGGFEQRVKFQAFVQTYIDNAISSTVNLPAWGQAGNNPDTLPFYKRVVLEQMPNLRGLTVYPDGAIPFQPLRPITLRQAVERGYDLGSSYSRCSSGVCEL